MHRKQEETHISKGANCELTCEHFKLSEGILKSYEGNCEGIPEKGENKSGKF